MTNTKKWFAAAAVLTLSTTMAFAHDGREGRGGRHGGHGRGERQFGERLAQKLNLSEAQKQQIEDSQKNFREENKSLFEAARNTRKQMHEARKAGDTATMEALKATSRWQHDQLKQLREAQMQRIETFLTSEQRAQWQAMKAERESRREHRGKGERF